MIKVALFYSLSNNFWPFIYRFNKNKVSKRCSQCINSERYIEIKNGICLECVEYNASQLKYESEISKNQHLELKGLDDSIATFYGLGKRGYDALVLFSGGKDSTMLIHRLIQDHPKLRFLSVTIDNHFLSPVAIENVNQIVGALDVNHFFYRTGDQIHKKAFRYAIENVKNRGGAHVIDRMDGDLFHDIAFHLAAKMEIPLVLSGLSKEQARDILLIDSFELPKERLMTRREQSGFLNLSEFATDADYQNYFWSPKSYQALPHVLFPNSVWNYSFDEISKVLYTQCGLSSKQLEPLLTNYQLISVINAIDIRQIGYSSFEPEFAKMVREGKINRTHWLNLFQFNEYIFKHTHLFDQELKKIMGKLDLNYDECIKKWSQTTST